MIKLILGLLWGLNVCVKYIFFILYILYYSMCKIFLFGIEYIFDKCWFLLFLFLFFRERVKYLVKSYCERWIRFWVNVDFGF